MDSLLILGPFASGKTTYLRSQSKSSALTLFCSDNARTTEAVNELKSGKYDAVLIDDCDRMDARALRALCDEAKRAKASVLGTARAMVKGFERVEKRSVSHLSGDHQRFVSVMFGIFRAPKFTPSPCLTLQPIEVPSSDHKARAGAALLAPRLRASSVCVGPFPARLRDAMHEICATVRFIPAAQMYGRRADSVLVFMGEMPSQDLIEALTRSDSQLTVAFPSEAPPEALARIRQQVAPLIPVASPWVNWEGYATALSRPPKHQRTEYGGHIRPKTITALVADLEQEAWRRGLDTFDQVMALAAELLKWKSVPRHTMLQAQSNMLLAAPTKADGIAAELAMARCFAFVEPTTCNIVLPEAVHLYRRALFCESALFLRAWAAQPSLRWARQSGAAWKEAFADVERWGTVPPAQCELMASSPLPIVILPAGLRAVRDSVEAAVDDYVDPGQVNVRRSTLKALAELVQVVEHGSQEVSEALLGPNADVLADRRLFDRGRHFWCLAGYPTFITPQVPVRAGAFKGFCDICIGENAILELKCSAAHSFRTQTRWALQASIYAYTLERPTAYWFNLNTNQVGKISFNANLFA